MNGAPTKRQQILDAAESLFSELGYDRTTMRGIATRAEVGLPLIVYHFETKLNLYREVFAAHQHLNEVRQRRVNAVDPAAPDAVEQIVDAFLSLTEQPRQTSQEFSRLILREASDPASAERGVIRDFFDPMARDFVSKMQAALPDKPEGFHLWAYLFSVGALTSTFSDARAVDLQPGVRANDRREFLRRYMIAALRHG